MIFIFGFAGEIQVFVICQNVLVDTYERNSAVAMFGGLMNFRGGFFSNIFARLSAASNERSDVLNGLQDQVTTKLKSSLGDCSG